MSAIATPTGFPFRRMERGAGACVVFMDDLQYAGALFVPAAMPGDQQPIPTLSQSLRRK
ncbi:MAG: hypothetical protein ABIR52_11250 [Casimicrobiaceae bacterium]